MDGNGAKSITFVGVVQEIPWGSVRSAVNRWRSALKLLPSTRKAVFAGHMAGMVKVTLKSALAAKYGRHIVTSVPSRMVHPQKNSRKLLIHAEMGIWAVLHQRISDGPHI
jgi:hypothetical protein